MKRNSSIFFTMILSLLFFANLAFSKSLQEQNSLPHLKEVGETIQLIVDGKTFLVLGGEQKKEGRRMSSPRLTSTPQRLAS